MPRDDTAEGTVTPPFLPVTATGARTPANPQLAGGTGRVRDLRRRDALRLLARFRALRADQIERLLFAEGPLRGESRRVATHRIVGDLRRRGLVDAVTIAGSVRRPARGYVLTADGRRVYAAEDPAYPLRRMRVPSVVFLEHATMLADIAVALRDAARRGEVGLVWESDWEAVARLGSATAIPDALVTFEHAGWHTRAFIEADRSTEHDEAFASKVRRYVQLYLADAWRTALASWPLILMITTSDVRARELARVAYRVCASEGGLRIAKAFRATSLEHFSTSPFGPIWYLGVSASRVGILEAPTTSAADVGTSTP